MAVLLRGSDRVNSADSTRAVEVSVQAMERMYAEMRSVKDKIKSNMRNPEVDASHTQELLLQARGARYEPLPTRNTGSA